MKALVVEASTARFAASRAAAVLLGPSRGTGVGPLRLLETDPPELPGPTWSRVAPLLAGICGSDLATLDGRASRSLLPLVSFPFVPGHEVVGVATTGAHEGRRVVLEPVLGCLARATSPMCAACAEGQQGRCEQPGGGQLGAGLQLGYCAATGGGWSRSLVAHESQLHLVPDELTDRGAVMVEPAACAIHGALAVPAEGATVAVLGAGTLGLCVIAALSRFNPPATLTAVAKHPVQRTLARELGATTTVEPGGLARAVRRATGGFARTTKAGSLRALGGGADVVYDCVGSTQSLAESLAVVRPSGHVVLVGMPGPGRLDLNPLWQREIRLVGSYTYGMEHVAGSDVRTFALALELAGSAGLERLVSATYPLERYPEALAHAAEAGRRGAVKVVFDCGGTEPPRRTGATR